MSHGSCLRSARPRHTSSRQGRVDAMHAAFMCRNDVGGGRCSQAVCSRAELDSSSGPQLAARERPVRHEVFGPGLRPVEAVDERDLAPG